MADVGTTEVATERAVAVAVVRGGAVVGGGGGGGEVRDFLPVLQGLWFRV